MRNFLTKVLAPSLFLMGAFLFLAVPNVQAASLPSSGTCATGTVSLNTPATGSIASGATYSVSLIRNSGCTDTVLIEWGKRSVNSVASCDLVTTWNAIGSVSNPGTTISWNTTALTAGADYCIRLTTASTPAGYSADFTVSNLVLSATPSPHTINQSSLVPETSGVPVSNAAVEAAIIGVTPVAVNLQNTGSVASPNVFISPIGAGPNIQLWAKDTSNNWYDINVTGWITPPGISFPAGYNGTTNVYAISNTAGSYPLTVNLISGASVVATTSGIITVIADTTRPVGGLLTMITKWHPSPGIQIATPTANVYTITPALSIDGGDVFTSLSVVVTDPNLNTADVPVLIDGNAGLGHMTYSGGVWNFVQTGLPVFATGPHNLVATFSDNFANTTTLTATFTTDNTAPILQSFTSSTANGTYGPGAVINLTVTYNEAVTGTMTVTLNNGGSATITCTASTTCSGTYTVGITGSGQDKTGLDVSSFTQSMNDVASNNTTSTTLPGTTIITSSSINVDTTAPTLQSFTSTTVNGTYGPGAVINLTATYNEPLFGGSSISLKLDSGVTVGSSTVTGNTIANTYIVGVTGSSQDTPDLTVSSIQAEGVTDMYGNTKTNSSVPGTPNNIGDTRNIVVDTTAPTIGTVTITSGEYNPYVYANSFDLSATVSDAVSGVAGCAWSLDGNWTMNNITSGPGTYNSGPGTCTKTGLGWSDNSPLHINFRATDGAGNVGTGTQIDRTADLNPPTVGTMTYTPVYNNGGTDYTAASFTVKATITDTTSPLADCYYQFNGGLWTSVGPCVSPLTIGVGPAADGLVWSTNMRGMDTVGHVGTGSAANATVDALAPTSSADAGSTTQNTTTILVPYTANDAESGVKNIELYYRRNAGAWTSAGTYVSSPISFDSSTHGGDGTYDFYTVGTDNVGNVKVKAPLVERTTVVDTSDPTIVSATTGDNDHNGQIDRLTVVYSEAVNDSNYDAVAVAGHTITVASCTGTGTSTHTYVINEIGYSTGATPALTWTAGNAQDLAGNNLDLVGPPAAPTNATDGAQPVVINAKTEDNDHNGQIDHLVVQYSETVNETTVGVYDAVAVSGYTMPGTGGGSGGGDTLVYDLTGNGTPDTGATPALAWTSANAQDTATVPNLLYTTNAPANAADGAPPVPVSGVYLDNVVDGTIDRVDVTWSENITMNEFEAGDHTFNATSDFGAITRNSAVISGGNVLQISITPANSHVTAHGATTLDYSYVDSTTGSSIHDGAGNISVGSSPVVLTDNAKPYLISFTSTTPAGYYNAGDLINITANYTEALSSGLLTVILNSGGNEAGFAVSGSTLVATHIVGPGENTIAPPLPMGDLKVSSILLQNVQDAVPNILSNTSLPATNIDAQPGDIVIDTTRPLGTVTVQTNTIYEGDLVQEIQVAYNETMNTSPGKEPQFNWTGMTGTWSQIACPYGNNSPTGQWQVDNRTYRTCYQVTDTDEDTNGATVNSTGAEDLAGNTEGSGTTDSFTVDTYIALTDGAISISGATGTGGAYKIGDTLTGTWDNSHATGDNNFNDLAGGTGSDVASIKADLSQFGGGSNVTMTDTTACGGTAGDNIYEACYMLTGTEGIDATSRNATLTLIDNVGNTRTTADTTNATVDTIAPVVTGANISVTGANGTGGAFKFGDTPTLHWLGNTDGETDTIASAVFDGSHFKAVDTALHASDPGTPGTNNWSVGLSGAMDLQDDTGNTVTVTVTDDVGNVTTQTSTPSYIVDTIVPVVTPGHIFVNGASGTGGAFKNGDQANGIWEYGPAGDHETDILSSVVFDVSQFQASPGNINASPGSIDYTTGFFNLDSQDDTGNTVTVTVTDDAGNVTGPITSTPNYTVDTIIPTISGSCLFATGATGTAGAFKNADQVTGIWHNDNPGSGCTDGSVSTNLDISSVSLHFTPFVSSTAGASNAGNVWSAGPLFPLDSQDDTGNYISATVTDDAGNVTGPVDGTNLYVVDTILPTATIIKPVQGGTTDISFDADVTTNDNATCTYKLDAGASLALNGNGTDHVQHLASLTIGNHTFAIDACTDDAGNIMTVFPAIVTWRVSSGGGCLPGDPGCFSSGGGGGGGGGAIPPANANTNSTTNGNVNTNLNTNSATTTTNENTNTNGTTGTGSGSLLFTDTEGHWAQSFIANLQTKCGINGYKDAQGNLLYLFMPDKSVTRAELVQMLMQCNGTQLSTPTTNPFSDVDKDAWYAAAIAKAKELGWIDGYPDGTFKPNQNINRVEALKIVLLSQYTESTITGGTMSFTDTDNTAWYAKYVSFAVLNGYMEGYKDASGNLTGLFGPSNNLTRGESAKVLNKVNGW